jgi:hypothetical protein
MELGAEHGGALYSATKEFLVDEMTGSPCATRDVTFTSKTADPLAPVDDFAIART